MHVNIVDIVHNIIEKKYFKKYSVIIFSSLFVLIAFVYQFDDIIFMRPQSIHQWRQCDCLSFVLNYYNGEADFFNPKVQYLGDGSGKTVSDCPIIYYSVAQLWKVFGYHEFIYRLLVLSLCFAGLLALMKVIEDILKDSFIAIFISLLMYTSTILVYYSNNFLMNVPSFSFALIALYFFYNFYKTGKDIFLYMSMLMFLIGGLLKIPALTSFMAIFGLYILETFGFVKLKKNKKLFSKPLPQLIPFVLVAITIFSWYYYAYLYNKTYNSGIFLIGILPIWDLPIDRITQIISHTWKELLDSYHSPYIQYLSALLLIGLLVYYKKQNNLLLLITSFLFIGFILFIVLWFNVFDIHDYYLINQLVFMISIFVTFSLFLKNHYHKLFTSKWFRFVLIIILIQNVYFCRENITLRYFGHLNNGHKIHMASLETITQYLDSVGLNNNGKVLFMNDASFNISLYLMNRKGYTAESNTPEDQVKDRLNKVDYLLINDSCLLEREYIKNAIYSKLGTYKNVSIFSLRK